MMVTEKMKKEILEEARDEDIFGEDYGPGHAVNDSDRQVRNSLTKMRAYISRKRQVDKKVRGSVLPLVKQVEKKRLTIWEAIFTGRFDGLRRFFEDIGG